MLKFCTLFSSIIVFFTLNAQDNKGAKIVEFTQNFISSPDSTFAFVCGISDYAFLKSLNYADKDALVFYQHLISNQGEALPKQNVKLLTNNQVTRNNFLNGFYGFFNENINNAKRFIIYFSGHGDADIFGEHYLMMHACNPGSDAANYGGTDAVSLNEIKQKTRVYLQRGIEIIFIMDACRSKKLLGNESSGLFDFTSQNESSNGEILLQSCERGQVSLEGTQWGNGRGMFSFYLTEGLNGLADKDSNNYITIKELERYIDNALYNDENNKVGQTANFDYIKQSSEILFKRNLKPEYNLVAENTSTLNYEDPLKKGVYEPLNENISFKNENLGYFYTALNNQQLLGNSNKSAEYYLTQLKNQKAPESLVTKLNTNLGIALLDSSILIVNQYLNKNDNFQNYRYKNKQYFSDGLMMFQKAEELLNDGSNSFLIELNLPLKYFFEVSALLERANEQEIYNNLNWALNKIDTALQIKNNAAYLYHLKALLLISAGKNTEAVIAEKKAISLAPFWLYPYNGLGNIYFDQRDFKNAILHYNKALSCDTNSYMPYIGLGNAHKKIGKTSLAEMYFNKSVEKDSINPYALYNRALFYSQTNANNSKIINDLNKCLEIDDSFVEAYILLAKREEVNGEFLKAIEIYKKGAKYNKSKVKTALNDAIIFFNRMQSNEMTNKKYDYIDITEQYKKLLETL